MPGVSSTISTIPAVCVHMTGAQLQARFSLAGASVVGPAHARAGRNNQDAWSAWVGDDFAVLALADGCSGGAASEVGAHFAVRWVVAEAARRSARERVGSHEVFAGELFDGLARELGALALALAPEPEHLTAVVADLLLATVLVALVDHERTSAFAVGDGLVVVNGVPVVLEGDRQRGPAYLAYRLCDQADTGYDPKSIAPRLVAEVQTSTLRMLALASDGAHGLLPAKAGRDLLAALLEDGAVARRPALLHARLAELAPEPGLLDDDVTVVALMARAAPAGIERR
jgi:serine/threonine protein phosphatase PrpC